MYRLREAFPAFILVLNLVTSSQVNASLILHMLPDDENAEKHKGMTLIRSAKLPIAPL